MTKERLRNFRALRLEALQLREQLAEVRASMYSPRSPSSGDSPPGGSGGGSAVENAVIRFAALEALYVEKIAAIAAEQLAVERAIDALGSTERQVLRARYINALSWEAVCVEVGYSWQHTHRLHARALAHLAEI